MKALTRIIAISTIAFLFISILIAFAGCKKESPNTYSVTYEFISSATSSYIQIWDVTNLNDFADSIHSGIFTKTIKYDYDATWRCNISTKNPASLKINITLNGITNTCESTLYPSLECFRTK